jgi:hypothetical protein
VKLADKNMGIVVVDTCWYVQQSEKALQSQRDFLLESDTTEIVLERWVNKVQEQLPRILQSFSKHPAVKNIKAFATLERKFSIPQFYGLVKIHKTPANSGY